MGPRASNGGRREATMGESTLGFVPDEYRSVNAGNIPILVPPRNRKVFRITFSDGYIADVADFCMSDARDFAVQHYKDYMVVSAKIPLWQINASILSAIELKPHITNPEGSD